MIDEAIKKGTRPAFK